MLGNGWEAHLHQITLSNCDLRYLRVGTGRTLVLLHPLRAQLEYFLPLIRALGDDFDIVVPDLPGRGHSSAPAVAYTATYFTTCIGDFLDACDLSEVILVGES